MKKGFVISMILTALQFIGAAALFSYLPEQIPIHFNISGVADGFAGRIFIFYVPFVSLVLTLFLYYLPKIVPKGENIERSGRIYPMLMVMISLIMAAILVITAFTAFGYAIKVNQILLSLIGIVMLMVGNYLPKVKTNYALGIRLPWTLNDETIWIKTHRFGGWVFLLVGLLFILGVFLPAPVNFILPMAVLLLGLFVTMGYAYQLHKKKSV